MTDACVMVDALHVKRAHAEDIADAIIAAIREGVERLWLYFDPNGAVGISLSNDPMRDPFALVGNYTAGVERQDIVDDIIASQREAIG